MYRRTKTVLADNPILILGAIVAFAALWNLLLCHRPAGDAASGVVAWWTVLCIVSLVNLCGWRLSAVALYRGRDGVEPSVYSFRQWQLLLSAVYVLGCGFRSVLPRADVQRIGLFDSWASSVMVGRSVATVAELCFVAQWALLLHWLGRDAESRTTVIIAWLLVPLIAVAEMFSWYSSLTTCYFGNAVEESIWALSAALMVVGSVALWSRSSASRRAFLAVAIGLGLVYVFFMCTVDVPMYVSRWLADEASGRTYLSLSQGLHDLCARWTVTFDWDHWRTEIPWMSLYFSVGVWCSIALVHIPRFDRRPKLES